VAKPKKGGILIPNLKVGAIDNQYISSLFVFLQSIIDLIIFYTISDNKYLIKQ